mgnify:CR=1 FL=1
MTKPARPFDPHWITELPLLAAYLDELCCELTSAETRGRRRSEDAQANFEAAIKAIVLDLFRADESDPNLEVGIATGQGTLQKRGASRYGARLLSPRSFRAAMDALLGNGQVIKTTSHWDDPTGKNSRTARYQASPDLLTGLREAGASLAFLRRHGGVEGIHLKDEKKNLVEYGEIRFANEARDGLKIINDMLESHWADLEMPDDELVEWKAKVRGNRDDEAEQSFDFAARTVHRVFNNNDWEQGGRFYGAWWISAPSGLRRYILIDGKRTVEVDYSGLHAAMLFAEQGLPIPADPYERCLSETGNRDERSLVKQTFNALLNANSVNAINPIDGYSEDLTGKSWKDFKHHIVHCFPEFHHQFGSAVGLRLQYKDSQLAEIVMKKFAAMQYSCLPVHDSFIVHYQLQGELTEAMQSAFEKMFGARGSVKLKIGYIEQVEPLTVSIGLDLEMLNSPPGYEVRLQQFWNHQSQK